MIEITNNCISCGMCTEQCPSEAIEFEKNKNGYAQARINTDLCMECGSCLDFDCPGEAIRRRG